MAESLLSIVVATVVWVAGATVTWATYGPAVALLLWAAVVPAVFAAFVVLVGAGGRTAR